jgi:hypothetical protein
MKEQNLKKILDSTEAYDKYKYLTPDRGSQKSLHMKPSEKSSAKRPDHGH